MKWYRYFFTDGFSVISSLSKKEIVTAELVHGKLLAKVKVDI